MAEEIRFKIIVDTANGAAVIAQLEKQLETLKAKLAQVKTTASPVIPSTAFDPLKTLPVNSVDALKNKLTELKVSLGKVEIGSAEFKKLTVEIQATQAQLNSANDALKGLDVAPVAGSLAALKQQIKEYKAEIEGKPIGSKEFETLKAKIAIASGELREMNKDLKGLTSEQQLKSVAKIGEGIVSSFVLASSSMELFGLSGKSAEEVTLAMVRAQQSLNVILSLNRVLEAVKEAGDIKAIALSKARAVATYAMSAAQAVFNAVMSANPIAIVLLAVTALVGGMIALKDKVAIVGKAFELAMAPLRLLLSGLEALGKAIGVVGEDDGKTRKVLKDQLELVEKRYTDELEIARATGKSVMNLEWAKLEFIRRSTTLQIEDLERLKKKKNELSEEDQKNLDELKQRRQDTENSLKILSQNTIREIAAAEHSAKRSKIEGMKDGFDKEKKLAEDSRDEQLRILAEQFERKDQLEKFARIASSKNREAILQNSTSDEQKGFAQYVEIQQQFQNETVKINRDVEKKRFEDRSQINILNAELAHKSSLEIFNVEVKNLEKERDFKINHESTTGTERQRIRLEYEKKIADKTVDFQKQALTDSNAVAILSTIENSQERLDAEIAAEEKLRKFRLDNEAQSEDQRRIIIAESDEKILKLKDAFRAAEAEKQRARIATVLDTENLIAQAKLLTIERELNNLNTSEERKIELIQQYADIEKAMMEGQARAELTTLDSKYLEATDKRRVQYESDLAALTQKGFDTALLTQQFLDEQKLADENYDANRLLKKQQVADKEIEISSFANRKILDEKAKTAQKEIQQMQQVSGAIDGIKQIELVAAGDNEKKKKEIAKRYAVFELTLGLAQIFANTQLAAAKTTAELGAVAAIPFLPFIYINGAIQAGVLLAQKAAILSLATGGLVDGPGTETSDSIPANLSRGESVINARSTKMFRPLLSAINEAGGGVAFDFSPGFAEGGVATVDNSETNAQLSRIAELLENQTSEPVRAYVVETELTRTQKRINTIERRATIG